MGHLRYTTKGDVRGCCGHRHMSLREAYNCLRRDQKGCASQGGYSDRKVLGASTRRHVSGYIATRPLLESEEAKLVAIAAGRHGTHSANRAHGMRVRRGQRRAIAKLRAANAALPAKDDLSDAALGDWDFGI